MTTQRRSRFIQIHALVSYAGVLLNRDDTGAAKRLDFGGTTRIRVSSQSLKRHWRFAGEADHESAAKVQESLQNIGVPMGERTKELVSSVIMPAAMSANPGAPDKLVKELSELLHVELYGKNGTDPKARQALLFGQPEVDYLQAFATQALAGGMAGEKLKHAFKEARANMAALKHAAGLESALFGRMVTSDTAANRDAPIHVQHAFTVHAMERELDFVTVVDDLRQRDPEAEAGSAGMFDVELTSGVFYSYVNIDVDLLVSNLGGDVELAGRVVDCLVHLIAKVSPGAKKGSTAPFAAAEYMLVEAGADLPRSLAGAFRNAVPLKGDVFQESIHRLGRYLTSMDKAYGKGTDRRQMVVGMSGVDGIEEGSIGDLAAFVASAVAGSQA